MWVDTHCHLDAQEFNGEGDLVAARARAQGVQQMVVPAVCCANFASVAELGKSGGYALGIHPLFVPEAQEQDLQCLRTTVAAAMHDPYFVAIGEIGLDYFLPELCTPAIREKQEYFYREQLCIARDFGLPVLLHVRRSIDPILKQLRRIGVSGGIAHAFNGSEQQAQMLIQLGFNRGFGGALTFSRALRLRHLAATLPLSALVLETDAPDMAPSWLSGTANSPEHLPRIAEIIAQLRNISLEQLATQTTLNARAVLPRLPVLS